MVIDSSGTLYGVSSNGGTFGLGTVYKVTKSGALSVLHSFSGAPDGRSPGSGLFRDKVGNLFGTTFSGGTLSESHGDCSDYLGCGTVFKVTSSGKETILYRFRGGSDGAIPLTTVAVDSAGNVYGTVNTDLVLSGDMGDGIAFKISSSDQFSNVYTFCPLNDTCPDGSNPFFGIIIDSSGNFYGNTIGGGTADGSGTSFQITKGGIETVLHSFNGSTDGVSPSYDLNEDANGNLYGVTNRFGPGKYADILNGGTLFKLTKAGEFTVLYSFCSLPNCTDGDGPIGPVQIDANGNLFGIAGPKVSGSSFVFELNTKGEFSVVFTFPNVSPAGGLIIDSSGNLYGTTFNGGHAGLGSVYKLTLAK